MRRSTSIFLGLIATVALAGAQAPRIDYNGKELRINPAPIKIGAQVLLPLRATASAIGASVNTDRIEARITWRGNRVDYRPPEAAFELNGRRQRMDRGSVERRGVLFVDSSLFEALTGGELRVWGRLEDQRWDRDKPRPRDDDWRTDDWRYRRDQDPWVRDEDVVRFDNRELRFDREDMPFRSGRTLMVPFRAIGSMIGARTERTDDGKRVIIRMGRYEVVYDRGQTSYRLNRVRRNLPAASRDRGDVFFVPIELFDAVADGRLSWNRR